MKNVEDIKRLKFILMESDSYYFGLFRKSSLYLFLIYCYFAPSYLLSPTNQLLSPYRRGRAVTQA